MRVCIVHSFYRSGSPSGENEIVLQQIGALQAAGHDVLLLSQESDRATRGATDVLLTALRVATSTGIDPTDAIRALNPDVVHVHNTFPTIGAMWIPGVARRTPVVSTLHNFRPVCAAATLYRDGAGCEECVGSRLALPALRHRCYRGSMAATLPLFLAQRGGLARNPLFSGSTRLVALSPRVRRLYERAGADPLKLVVIPNGLKPAFPTESTRDPRRWVYVGRLTAEKGVKELVLAWPPGVRLDVVGHGPLAGQVAEIAAKKPDVRLLGALTNAEVRAVLGNYGGLVMPSRWPEAAPLVVMEAMSAGTPVLARGGTSAADTVAALGGGLVYQDDAQLPNLVEAWDSTTLGEQAEGVYAKEFTIGVWIDRLERLYEGVRRD